METLIYNAARITLSQYGKDLDLSTASVALLVSGVNTSPF